ncbi:hypothetical protein ROZALSC1DRAFT_29617 [Rozella allomycis CSF55]|uniref:Uncharacterized protein n=1 Tax=Rozella allomycis (strain CSF55) TaxID=988480 RepID=A0A075B5B4_ROZAC|nr:hypothetical protein O9G_004460 [Rozella allomycis CSF55]RKP18716.1 hypothetical protein ROZALSC1DRAFT_29617 [Rozella allomycis CSF55]|eukprot:EPZ37049.1 hypothetical protein O9G_004460 [Rozella allomycis CSF55]
METEEYRIRKRRQTIKWRRKVRKSAKERRLRMKLFSETVDKQIEEWNKIQAVFREKEAALKLEEEDIKREFKIVNKRRIDILRDIRKLRILSQLRSVRVERYKVKYHRDDSMIEQETTEFNKLNDELRIELKTELKRVEREIGNLNNRRLEVEKKKMRMNLDRENRKPVMDKDMFIAKIRISWDVYRCDKGTFNCSGLTSDPMEPDPPCDDYWKLRLIKK